MRRRFLLPVLLISLAWAQELLDQVLFGGTWTLAMGPGMPWWGVFTAPFSHSGFGHLLSNTVVFLPLSWLVLTRGLKGYLAVWLAVILINVPIALFWPARSHGMSGVILCLLGYLLLIGWLEKRVVPIILGIITFGLYGSALIALIPGVSPAGVSWIGHAGGFVAGLLAASAVYQDTNRPDLNQG